MKLRVDHVVFTIDIDLIFLQLQLLLLDQELALLILEIFIALLLCRGGLRRGTLLGTITRFCCSFDAFLRSLLRFSLSLIVSLGLRHGVYTGPDLTLAILRKSRKSKRGQR